jgi:hypothetical protein
MKPLNPTSGRALTWLGAALLAVGFLVSSPSGAFCAFVLATVLSAAPALFGAGKLRVAAAVLLLASLALSASKYSAFKSEQETYRARAAGSGSR